MERRNAYTVLVRSLEGKKLLGRPRRRWKDDIKVDHKVIRCYGLDWIELNQDRAQCRALVNNNVSCNGPLLESNENDR
jgi:hypothetical protein